LVKKLVIIPAFNEEKSIGGVLSEVKEFCPDFDIVVVSDGSDDRTTEVARNVPGVSVVDLPINLGIGGAVQTGFIYGWMRGYNLAVQVDADGQHKPSEVPKLLEPILLKEADVTIGSRFMGKGMYRGLAVRKWGIRFFSLTNRLILGERITDSTSGFRAYNERAIEILSRDYPDDYPEPEAVYILKRRGLVIKEVPVEMAGRKAGRSSISLFESVYYMVKVFLAIFVLTLRKKEQREPWKT
jgi:glycosyltransferase involved in cell wall biosynthesis